MSLIPYNICAPTAAHLSRSFFFSMSSYFTSTIHFCFIHSQVFRSSSCGYQKSTCWCPLMEDTWTAEPSCSEYGVSFKMTPVWPLYVNSVGGYVQKPFDLSVTLTFELINPKQRQIVCSQCQWYPLDLSLSIHSGGITKGFWPASDLHLWPWMHKKIIVFCPWLSIPPWHQLDLCVLNLPEVMDRKHAADLWSLAPKNKSVVSRVQTHLGWKSQPNGEKQNKWRNEKSNIQETRKNEKRK